MNLRTLEYLVKVAETRHFSKAADQCCVTQPTLSTQLKKLESHLGVIIFERDNKNVMLTPLGSKLVNQAKQVLLEAKQLKVIANNAANPLSGKYSIGVIPSISPYLIPKFLNKVKSSLKDLKVFVIEDNVESLLEMLRIGKLDAVVMSPPIKQGQQFDLKHLFDEELYCVVPDKHRFVTRDALSVSDLFGETILSLDEKHCLRNQTQEILGQKILSQDFNASSPVTLKHLIAQGHGISLLPKMACQDLPDGLKVIPIQKDNESPKREIVIATRPLCVRQQANQSITDVIKDCQ